MRSLYVPHSFQDTIMHDKYVKLQDISPLQDQLTGLPFGIYDLEHHLFNSLNVYVYHRHRDHDKKEEVLKAIRDRWFLINNNRAQLSKMYERAYESIGVINGLTRVIEIDQQRVQFLVSDIQFTISDSIVRYKQPPLCFRVDEDYKTWLETVQVVEKLFETSGLRADISEAIAKARVLPTSKPITTPPVSIA